MHASTLSGDFHGDIGRDCGERQRQIGECRFLPGKVGDHRGQSGIGEQVRLDPLQQQGLGEQTAREHLIPRHPCPHVREPVHRTLGSAAMTAPLSDPTEVPATNRERLRAR